MNNILQIREALSLDLIERLRSLPSSGSCHEQDGHGGGGDEELQLDWVAEALLPKLPKIREGSLVASGVHPRMKLYRLREQGGVVARHQDEDFLASDGSLALYSILVRLNTGYVGGETVFWGNQLGPSCEVGDALLFKHNVPHEGLPVLVGEKVVLKTDLLFREFIS